MKNLTLLTFLIVSLLIGCSKNEDFNEEILDPTSSQDDQASTTSFSVIDNGITWKTTGGAIIKAQGGNIYRENGVLHWFGHDFTNGTNFNAVNHYTSTNLSTWTNAGPAFSSTSYSPSIGLQGNGGAHPFDGKFLGRPFVMKNSAGTYVMIVSFDSPSTAARNTYTFLTATNINGPWTYDTAKNIYNLDDANGNPSSLGDLGAYYDNSTGKGYLVYTYDEGVLKGGTYTNKFNGIRKLNSTLTAPLLATGALVQFVKVGSQSDAGGGGREAASIFKRGNYYYHTSSGTSGWNGSVTWYRTATALPEPGVTFTSNPANWSTFRPMPTSPSSNTSYDTQHDQIVGLGNDLYLYCGDRWPDSREPEGHSIGPGGASAEHPWPSRNGWFPLSFAPSTIAGEAPVPTLNAPNYGVNGGDWQVNLTTGDWQPL